MKPNSKLLGAITAVIGIGLLFATTTHAMKPNGAAPSRATQPGRASTGNFSGYPGGYRGNPGGYYGGYRGGYRYYGNYYGGFGYPRYSSCGNWWYPWSFSLWYDFTPTVSCYATPTYYSAPVVYSTPTVAYSSPPATPSASPADQPKPLAPTDVVALVKAGISDEVIISQIRNSRTVYRLTVAEIIDMKNNGVSEKVIDFMINTASQTH